MTIAFGFIALGAAVLPQDFAATIRFVDDSVQVEVRAPGVEPPDFQVMLRSGQTIHWRSSLARVDTTAGVVRITAGDPIIRYVIAGDTRRIPLPVPTTPMPQDRRTGRVSILGLPPTIRLDRTFPRLAWNGDTATADLRDIPSIVRVQFGSGWGVEQWSEAFVVVLVIVSSLLWYRRSARG